MQRPKTDLNVFGYAIPAERNDLFGSILDLTNGGSGLAKEAMNHSAACLKLPMDYLPTKRGNKPRIVQSTRA